MKRHQAFQFALHLLRAQTAHGIHSPFVYEFVTQVLYSKKNYYRFPELKAWKDQILSDPGRINITDRGTGKNKTEIIGERAQRISLPDKFLKLIFKTVHQYNPRNILELGTGFGITAGYAAAASQKARVTTVEGCPQTAAKARDFLKKLNLTNAEVFNTDFDEFLDHRATLKTQPWDLVFIDGNHDYEPTLRYFRKIIPHCADDAVLIFDDIHWSKSMTRAWSELIDNERCTCSVDLYRLGFVFLSPRITAKHYRVFF